jgi:hypothetical protein
MRFMICSFLLTAATAFALAGLPLAGQTGKDKAKAKDAKTAPAPEPKLTGKETPAELTRKALLKTKVSGVYENERLGEILKDFAEQVDRRWDKPVLWAYGPGFPYSQKITYSCDEKPLDDVLDQLLKKAGGGLGYVVVSKDGDKYDGWVRLTTGGERGTAQGAASAEDEASAAEKLALAKKLLDAGKPASAKPLLDVLVKKYGNTKAGAEAKDLLEKLDK